MGHRLPTILGKAIEDVLCTVNTLSDEDEIIDLLACVKRMEILKAELEGNGKLRPIIDDGEADVTLWNKEIAKWFTGLLEKYPEIGTQQNLTFAPLRQRLHERYLAVRGSLQIFSLKGMLHDQQEMGEL